LFWEKIISIAARETIMGRRTILPGVRFLAFTLLLAGSGTLPAQTTAPALTGKVTAEQGALEGVLVSAKKAGSNVTITVVSDKDGRYSFPAAKLDAGEYTLRIRAVGYDLDNTKPIAIAPDKTATADLSLHKT
jgi:virginiamycin B lyase